MYVYIHIYIYLAKLNFSPVANLATSIVLLHGFSPSNPVFKFELNFAPSSSILACNTFLSDNPNPTCTNGQIYMLAIFVHMHTQKIMFKHVHIHM